MDIVAENGNDHKMVDEGKAGGQIKVNDNDEYEFMIPLNTTTKLKPFVDRYFVKYFRTTKNEMKPEQTVNQYAFLHTNKLFMLGLAKEHDIIKNKMKIESISFECLTKGNSLEVKGKKKKGGFRVQAGTKMCVIKCAGGEEYNVYGMVEGTLIEINERVQQDPQILLDYPETKGYLAIVNSGLQLDKMVSSLIPEVEYRKLCTANEVS